MRTLHFIFFGTSTALALAFSATTGCSSDSTPATTTTTGAGAGTTSAGGGTSTATGTGGSTSTAGTGGMATTGTGGAATTGTGGSTSSSTGTGGAGGAAPLCSGATPVALTVKNFDNWCTLTANGAAIPVDGVVCVADAAKVSLTATANAGFELGDDLGNEPWHDTDGDPMKKGETGTVANGVSTATITVSGSKACVWACCPFAGPNPPKGSGCPAVGMDQCP